MCINGTTRVGRCGQCHARGLILCVGYIRDNRISLRSASGRFCLTGTIRIVQLTDDQLRHDMSGIKL
jgi:hypothetical protein